jgi:hypothetical protein
MALQTTAYLSGKIDNVVFYKRGNTHIARSIPDEVKQSSATKKRSTNFGIAVSAGKALRQFLQAGIPFPKDKKMQNAFSGAISKWLKVSNVGGLAPENDLPFVNGFSFNESTSIEERWKTDIIVMRPSDDLMTIQIPSFIPTEAISAPAYTKMVKCSFTIAACQLNDATALGSDTVTIQIPYNADMRDAQILSLPVRTGAGAIVVTVATLTYYFANGEKDERPSFMPSSIIDARYC